MPRSLRIFGVGLPSKAQVARSNRAGQAKFHIPSYKSRLVDCVRLDQSLQGLAGVWVALGRAWKILGDYGQLRSNFDPDDLVSVRPDSEVSLDATVE